jgi:hypothetical protein
MWTELIVSLIVVLSFIGIYYWVTGTPPGARLIEQEPPTDSKLDGNQANFMFFYASWCPHCGVMKREVFTDATVVDFYSKNFVCMAVDVESEYGKELKTITTSECNLYFEIREFGEWSSFDEFIKHSRKMRL